MEHKTIEDIINEEYYNFSLYTLENRAIPSMIDGMKPVHRKIFYVMRNKAKSVKVSAIGASIVVEANYHHGDASAADAAIKLAQGFPGSNNVPMLLGEGEFGSQVMPGGAASPRYIFAKMNPAFEGLFKDYEICPSSPDPENPEPFHYLPIIPTVLLNGAKGLAVAYRTSIECRKLEDIVHAMQQVVLKGNDDYELPPYYEGYSGKIVLEDGKYVMYGVWEKVNTTTLHITEIPTGTNREKYIEHLDKLVEDKKITSYEDRTDSKWDIVVTLPRKSVVWNNPNKHLKLTKPLSENITVTDENGKVRVYEDVKQLVRDFAMYRMSMYEKRKEYMVELYTSKIAEAEARIRFIQEAMGLLQSKGARVTKADYTGAIKKAKATQYKDKLLNIPVHKISSDEIARVEKQVAEYAKERDYYKNVEANVLFRKELMQLNK